MATADAIREQIRLAEERLDASRRELHASELEVNSAEERQRLRNVLADVERRRASVDHHTRAARSKRELIDNDIQSADDSLYVVHKQEADTIGAQQVTDCSECVANGTEEWQIKGMLWLIPALEAVTEASAVSKTFKVGGHPFKLVYAPDPDHVHDYYQSDNEQGKGSLVLKCESTSGLAFRVSGSFALHLWCRLRSRSACGVLFAFSGFDARLPLPLPPLCLRAPVLLLRQVWRRVASLG